MNKRVDVGEIEKMKATRLRAKLLDSDAQNSTADYRENNDFEFDDEEQETSRPCTVGSMFSSGIEDDFDGGDIGDNEYDNEEGEERPSDDAFEIDAQINDDEELVDEEIITEGYLDEDGRKMFGDFDSEDEMYVIMAPIALPGAPIRIETDSETKVRSYYNPYFDFAKNFPNKLEALNRLNPSHLPPKEVKQNVVTEDELIDLYKGMNLYDNVLEKPTMDNVSSKFRLKCILIRGVKNMSTQDVFDYLRHFDKIPIKLEWVNDVQCIAVFANEKHAGDALISMTKPIVRKNAGKPNGTVTETDLSLVEEVPANWIDVPMPVTHVWRINMSAAHDKKERQGFLFTIARNTDKKQENAELVSDYYRENGNPNRLSNDGLESGGGLWTKSGYEKKLSRSYGRSRGEGGGGESSKSVSMRYTEERLPVRERLFEGKRRLEESFESDDEDETLSRRIKSPRPSDSYRDTDSKPPCTMMADIEERISKSFTPRSPDVLKRSEPMSGWDVENPRKKRGSIKDRLGWKN